MGSENISSMRLAPTKVWSGPGGYQTPNASAGS